MPMASKRVRRPNVIFILSDDQGPWAAGCYGNEEIRTPHIDQIAAEGVRFSKFFVACPVCSPSRATLLTGRINSQHGIHDWLNEEAHLQEHLSGEIAYTDVLAENDYICGLSGKWHIGDALHPQHGFSFWYAHQFGGGPYNNAPMVRAGQAVDDPGYVTDNITNEALKFIDACQGKVQPFYLSVHYTAPHGPWTGHPQDIVASYDDCPFVSCPQEPRHPNAIGLTDACLGNREMLKGYFAAVTAMDNNIGRILQHVDELGLRNDTIIIFSSDNGFSCGHNGFWGKGNGTSPRNMYENSITVPFVIRDPGGSIPAGYVSDAMMSTYDFMPTLLDYLGFGDQIPYEEQNLPGTSFKASWEGDDNAAPDAVVVYDEYGPVRMIRTRKYKYVERHPNGPNELWDIVNDPQERLNLIDEAALNEVRSELQVQLRDWFARYAITSHDGRNETHTAEGRPIGTYPWPPINHRL